MLHSAISHPTLRDWSRHSNTISKTSLVYPVFIASTTQEIKTLPGIKRFCLADLNAHLEPLVMNGLKSIIIFPVPSVKNIDTAHLEDNPAIPAIRQVRASFPDLLVCVDLCLCAFTDHGHCGILSGADLIDNDASNLILAKIAGSYALAGAQVIAPSDMMDGRVKAIKDELVRIGKRTVPVMAYSAKFASVFYGPFRDAAGSGIKGSGDRKHYQLPPSSRGLAKQALLRDVQEGADIVMVKPGGAYLDIVRDARNLCPDHPIAVYQVSGEYAMLWYAAEHGVFGLREGVMESLEAMMRAGANILITYYAPQVLDWLKD